MMLNRCRRCGRVLTAPSSVANGLGPECADKAGTTTRMLLVEGAARLLRSPEEWEQRTGREALQRLNDGRPIGASTKRLLLKAATIAIRADE